MQDTNQDGGREEVTVGELHAQHLGRDIELRSRDHHLLVGQIAVIHHEGQHTELTITWGHNQTIVVQQNARERAILLPMPERPKPPPGGWRQIPSDDEIDEAGDASV